MRYVPFSGATRRPDWLLAEPVTPQVCLTLGTLLPRRDPQQSEIWRLVLRVLAELDHEAVVAIGRKHVPLLGELPHGVRAEPVPLSGVLRVVVGDGPPRTAVRDLAQENRSRPSPDAVAADLAASVGAPGPERVRVGAGRRTRPSSTRETRGTRTSHCAETTSASPTAPSTSWWRAPAPTSSRGPATARDAAIAPSEWR
jgi:hypothetical protein